MNDQNLIDLVDTLYYVYEEVGLPEGIETLSELRGCGYYELIGRTLVLLNNKDLVAQIPEELPRKGKVSTLIKKEHGTPDEEIQAFIERRSRKGILSLLHRFINECR